MPLALSIHDLHETIIKRLEAVYGNPLPSNINIPSDEWIRLQFCFTNATTIQAMYYTGRFKVNFKVQGRMLQKSSEDAHYCAALFRYFREFCIRYRQWACLISADDKHKIPIREDVAVSTGSTLAAADHDFSKLSLTPSVVFLISIPNDISGLFYDESELKECITGIQEILKNRTVRLRLKNNKFKCHSPASQEEITEVFEVNI
ncbi:5584_t:CDS:2 [Racocetra fulgida]|uniref:5584_t:CDS:1 n=1 Tax=Racocetra fulgida TaxID=60492 RepID=A0A9N9H687_9GLOM|nr:5584_t:CDS:2 [Racocetra fulgida]